MIKFRNIGFLLLGLAYAVSVGVVVLRMTRENSDDRIVIRLSQWQLEGTVRAAIDEIIRRYEEINPRVRVIHIAVPDRSYLPWVQTQMIGGTGPDMVEYSWTSPDIALHFQPITDDVMRPNPYNRGTELEGVPWRDTFVDALVTDDGFVKALNQYYGVTMTTHIPRIVYNKDLMKKITGKDGPPENYRELLEIDRQVRAYGREHQMSLVTMANSIDSARMIMDGFVSMTAGHVAQRLERSHRLQYGRYELAQSFLRGEWSYYTPDVQAGLEIMKTFGEISTPGFVQRLRDSALNDFVNGRALMMLTPSWEASSLFQLCPFPIAAFRYPMPMQDDPVYGKYSLGIFSEGQVVTGMPFYVSRSTKHRAEVIDFLQFMTSKTGSQIFTDLSHWQPSIRGVEPSAFAAQFKQVTEGYTFGAGASFTLAGGNETRNYFYETLHTIWAAGGSVEAMQKELTRGMPGKILAEFSREARVTLQNTRREDTAATAVVLRDPGEWTAGVLPLMAIANETALYQLRDSLEQARGRP